MSGAWTWDETRGQGTYDAADEASTRRFGQALAQVLPPGTVVALSGTLGAGKTRLVQGLAAGLGIDPEQVVSPTFGICHEHPARADRPGLNHLDLYRVADADELLELGFDEYCGSDRITAIEWADRFPREMPRLRLDVEMLATSEGARRIVLCPRGPGLRASSAAESATGDAAAPDGWLLPQLRRLGDHLRGEHLRE